MISVTESARACTAIDPMLEPVKAKQRRDVVVAFNSGSRHDAGRE
jgi:hypothetical protein